ncbi:unnamed protein product [Pelagomonas calceolata]|uniref:PDZ domain-containing protein n=1 Tax=Pelagomonas calceolata TaxID=35677 RepID=A0A7S4A5A3_9STRA|nr:unnamed protein product [Pelagomonas calceolata]
MAAGTEHSVAAATHEAKQPLDISRPPAGILIVDNFLDEAEISDALTQLDRLEQERGDQQTATCPAKRQFLINVPAVADRLRSEIDASLGLVPIEATEGGAPQQEWLPARVMHGPTAEHRDEPQSAAPWAQSLDATRQLDANKEAYRGGYIAIVYLGGDGALVLGSGPAAREVPVVPGRLVAWPNTDFVHSAVGHERRLLGPLAVVPGDRTAPLWLTVIASAVGGSPIFKGIMCAIIAWLIAQLTMGIVFLDDDSKCSSNAAPFGLAIWNLTSFCWKAFIMAYFVIFLKGTEDERKARFHRQVTFYLLVIHWVWIILGLVITINIDISGSHSSCPSGLYWFTVLSIAALYVNMSLMMVPVALEYTKWQALAIGGPIVGACAVVALALATEVPWFGVILVAASTFPTLVILNLVAIDVRKFIFYKAYLLEEIEKLEHKLAKAKQEDEPGSVDEYSRKLADRRAELASLGNSSTRAPREGEVVEAASVGIIPPGGVEVEAPPGRLGLRFETGTGHQVISVSASSPLAGRVSVGDRLVSIRAPGREFYCGSLRTGSDIVAEFRATAGTKRVLTFARDSKRQSLLQAH